MPLNKLTFIFICRSNSNTMESFSHPFWDSFFSPLCLSFCLSFEIKLQHAMLSLSLRLQKSKAEMPQKELESRRRVKSVSLLSEASAPLSTLCVFVNRGTKSASYRGHDHKFQKFLEPKALLKSFFHWVENRMKFLLMHFHNLEKQKETIREKSDHYYTAFLLCLKQLQRSRGRTRL